ncbi:FAD-dependent monooxygenase [Kutzneria sp. NPDC052558]|uniref:FAD-dependent monooxygenase n=1 Tax=Kutzneria sp. NPDC052558 TaxID=3364121 RepID=UPI0037CC44AE
MSEATVTTVDNPVLVVGAGPVGLVAACELARRGVPVRVIDRSRTPVAQSKAIIVWPRTLELLAGLGIADEMVAAGHQLDGVRFHSNGSVLGSVTVSQLPDSRYNHVLMLPQWETERFLQARYAELGGVIEWGAELTDLSQDDDGVTVTLATKDGPVEKAVVSWVVGADGAHSTVRKLVGIEYTVHTPNMTFAIADAPVAGPVDQRYLHYCYSAKGAIGVGPLGDGVFRFAVNVKDGQQPDRELFQAALNDRAGGMGTVGEPKWSALFQVRCATADRFRAGRVFLAGDAAHVVSPAGGQGLNTGIHDAVNLGWKLAGVVNGQLRERILDSYHEERHEAVRRVSAVTDKQTRWGLITDPAKVLVRDLLARAAALTGVLQRLATPLFCQTDLHYGPALAWWKLLRYPAIRVGGRLPYLADECGASPLPTLVLSPGAENVPATLPYTLPVKQLPAGRLASLLGPAKALLVRPDGHILAVAPADRPEALVRALRPVLTDGATILKGRTR